MRWSGIATGMVAVFLWHYLHLPWWTMTVIAGAGLASFIEGTLVGSR